MTFRPIAQSRLFAPLGVCFVVCLSSLLFALLSGSPLPAYQALLVNTLFFFGLSHGSLMASAILTLTHAKWGSSIKRVAESTVLFIPICWILFGILLTGTDYLFLWLDPQQVAPEKTWWLNKPFFLVRNLIVIIGTGIAGAAYVSASLTPNLIYLEKNAPDLLSKAAGKLVRGSSQTLEVSDTKRQIRFASLYAALFIVSSCLVAFDWMMSLDQHWISTAFGFQYAIANLYAACAFLVIGFALARRSKSLAPYFNPAQLNDLSRLLLVSSLLWTYLVFSQILVIWYANLPEETPYLLLRMKSARWGWVFHVLFISLFMTPLIGLLTKRACRSPVVGSVIASACFIGLWIEKYYLIVPSIEQHRLQAVEEFTAYAGIFEITITLGMAAGFLFCILNFFRIFPFLPVSAPMLSEE
jgi:hypothetical protein